MIFIFFYVASNLSKHLKIYVIMSSLFFLRVKKDSFIELINNFKIFSGKLALRILLFYSQSKVPMNNKTITHFA